jgi:sugar lactone lactonase YvrE
LVAAGSSLSFEGVQMKISLLLIGFLFSQSAWSAIPEQLIINSDALYPEGVAYNSRTGEFYVSSLRKGAIGTLNSSGVYTQVFEHPDLISSIGLSADITRDRLIACVSDPGVGIKTNEKTKGNLARLMVFNVNSKKLIKKIELGQLKKGGHFCNDMTVDDQGNIYVTDSFSPVIYKVDKAYKASIFAESESFKGEGFNLNGIVYHPKGYLLVAKYNDGSLWKVSVKNPKDITQIRLKEPYSGLDGLVLISENEVVGIQNNGADKVHKFTTSDDWKTASTVTVTPQLKFPTTGVKTTDGVYVVEGKLSEIFADIKTATSSKYTLKAIDFKKE